MIFQWYFRTKTENFHDNFKQHKVANRMVQQVTYDFHTHITAILGCFKENP